MFKGIVDWGWGSYVLTADLGNNATFNGSGVRDTARVLNIGINVQI
ncbi:IS1-like element transposase [Aeromonas media]